MSYKILFIILLNFIATSLKAAFFEKGDACLASQNLVTLVKAFDAKHSHDDGDPAPSHKPLYQHLQNVDQSRQATTGDVEAAFNTILTLRYHNHPLKADFFQSIAKAQGLAYKVMDMACEILLNAEKAMSLQDLRAQTIGKAQQHQELKGLTKEYIAALIPDTALTLITYPDFKEIPTGWRNTTRRMGQEGILLGQYNRAETLKDLQDEKSQGKAVYLVLGRGNRQLAPAGQKTADGKEIVWVYADSNAQEHSVNRKEYFLWENFNVNLGAALPKDFFDAVIFDNSVTKFIDDSLSTVIQITKILTQDGFLVFPPSSKGGMLPILYKDSNVKYEFPWPYSRNKQIMRWPELTGNNLMSFPFDKGTVLQGQDRELAYDALFKTLNDCLQELFAALFEKAEVITDDKDVGFQLARYDFSPTRPGFRLTKPKKEDIQKSRVYKNYYNPEA